MPDVHGAGDHHGPRDASTSSHGCVVSNEINYGSWEQSNKTNSTKRTRTKKTRRSFFNLCYGIFVMAVGCVLRGTDG